MRRLHAGSTAAEPTRPLLRERVRWRQGIVLESSECIGRGKIDTSLQDVLPRAPMPYGVVSVALQGELVSGDAWSYEVSDDLCTVMLADGLGHGPAANRAAIAAVGVLAGASDAPLDSILRIAHDTLRSTVGAAVGVARFPSMLKGDEATIRFAGAGNISASVYLNQSSKYLPSHDGIVGHALRRVQEFEAPCPENSLVVLHSDGLISRWDLRHYPGILACHPSLIAAILYRDFARGRDDVTIFVARAARLDEVLK